MGYLKEKLEEKHISQKDLAIRTGELKSTISRYANEENKRGMRLDLAYKISIALDIPIEEFVKGIIENGN